MQSLLELLQDGRFHSGEDLGRILGVSRSAVWKQLQVFQGDLGIEVHRVPGKGYRLARPLSLLRSDQLAAAELPWPLRVMGSVDSTNVQAVRLFGDGCAPPFAVLAERQTAGRGRRGRPWVSPFAENLYYSLLWQVSGGMRQLEGLSLVVGLALVRTLHDMGVGTAGLKWPNDVLVDGRKIAGILLELSGDPEDVCQVVIGVGVNVNMPMTIAREIDQPWISMRDALGEPVDRNELAIKFSRHLQDYLQRHQSQGFSAFTSEWEQHHLWQGRQVALSSGAQPIVGMVIGVDSSGALRLMVDGGERVFSGGELSLRLHHDS
ncbi:BirA family transcriptional regulator, biotin operon repressor / biotin-[acetyl-CoA-carboxylase] ligase [Pseudomonas cuatrocienegasensis]|uniref:Bifunctional ligase/repressor BirA n=1 Tax=Pseudomonas cuatrocienegasensis TaxID=543360 RepID=A0ABY1BEU6_9PSED|nr:MULTISPECIES: bifunctional biotin--[acetyl-CoA-carboxylase] ligase/biotin operon repressor BirA [Pseudomonas]OEC32522.1 biotin--[acetyl-CoA-carboxylase] ligase [Pseudomonas sp. 21C1]SEQ68942.1 BirA family transcriptional regulator, biotin operon repressor / biotin-[acetyl-CoA-carboxylase] ligase [Pseudomonas cuatrocienegasensis]